MNRLALPKFLPHGQHLGILLIEFGVGMTVASAMITIFFIFAGSGSGSAGSEEA